MALETVGQDGRAASLDGEWQRAQSEVRALGASVGAITVELRTLMQKEAQLAQAEIAESVAAARQAAIFGAAGGYFAMLVVGFAALALMFGLATVMETWAAALATAGVLLVLGIVCGVIARSSLKNFSVPPKRTINSLQEDMTWAREQISRNAK